MPNPQNLPAVSARIKQVLMDEGFTDFVLVARSPRGATFHTADGDLMVLVALLQTFHTILSADAVNKVKGGQRPYGNDPAMG